MLRVQIYPDVYAEKLKENQMTITDGEKPVAGTIIRPALITQFDPEKKVMAPAYEDLTVTPHGKSPKNDWIYRVRKEQGVWRAIRPSDRGGGLIVFVHEDQPPIFSFVAQKKKLLIRIVKVLGNAAVGNLFIGD